VDSCAYLARPVVAACDEPVCDPISEASAWICVPTLHVLS